VPGILSNAGTIERCGSPAPAARKCDGRGARKRILSRSTRVGRRQSRLLVPSYSQFSEDRRDGRGGRLRKRVWGVTALDQMRCDETWREQRAQDAHFDCPSTVTAERAYGLREEQETPALPHRIASPPRAPRSIPRIASGDQSLFFHNRGRPNAPAIEARAALGSGPPQSCPESFPPPGENAQGPVRRCHVSSPLPFTQSEGTTLEGLAWWEWPELGVIAGGAGVLWWTAPCHVVWTVQKILSCHRHLGVTHCDAALHVARKTANKQNAGVRLEDRCLRKPHPCGGDGVGPVRRELCELVERAGVPATAGNNQPLSQQAIPTRHWTEIYSGV